MCVCVCVFFSLFDVVMLCHGYGYGYGNGYGYGYGCGYVMLCVFLIIFAPFGEVYYYYDDHYTYTSPSWKFS